MLAIHPRFVAIILHPIYALGSFGLLVLALSLSRGLTGVIFGELFLILWTAVCLAWWWWLLKRSGLARVEAPRRKLATAGLYTLLAFLVEGWLLPSYNYPVDALLVLLTIIYALTVTVRRWRAQQTSGLAHWWPTTSTGVWLGIVSGLFTTALILVAAAPSLG